MLGQKEQKGKGRRRRRRRRRRSGVELLPERLRPPHLSPVKQHETLSALMCRLSPCLCLYLNRRVVGFVCVTQPGPARPGPDRPSGSLPVALKLRKQSEGRLNICCRLSV